MSFVKLSKYILSYEEKYILQHICEKHTTKYGLKEIYQVPLESLISGRSYTIRLMKKSCLRKMSRSKTEIFMSKETDKFVGFLHIKLMTSLTLKRLGK